MSDRLPFSRWDIEPYVDESITGYFRRLVARENHSSTRTYAMGLGLTDRASSTGDILATVLSLPMREDWKSRLKHAAALQDGSTWLLGGEVFAQRQVGISKRRWCRGCLHEADYDRCWWSIVAIERCPFHDLPIESCHNPYFHWWTHIEEDAEGKALPLATARLADPTPSFGAYLLGRMGFGQRIASAFLDAMSMQDALDSWMLATFLRDIEKRVHDPSKPGFDEGFDLLSGTRPEAIEKLRIWLLRNSTPVDIERGIDACFRTARFRSIRVPMSSDVSALFTDILRRAQIAASQGAYGSVKTEADASAPHTSLLELAVKIGVGPKAASYAAQRLGFVPPRFRRNSRVWFSSAQVQEIQKFLDGFVTFREAAVCLGLTRYQVKPLVDAGLLEGFGNARINQGRHRHVHERDIARLLETLIDPMPEVEPRISWGLWTAARSCGMEPGQLAALVLSGKVNCLGRRRGSRRLNDLRFPRKFELPAEVRDRPRPQRLLVAPRTVLRRKSIVRKALKDGVDEAIRMYQVRASTLALWTQSYLDGSDGLRHQFPSGFHHWSRKPTALKSRVQQIARDEGIGCKLIAQRLHSENVQISTATIGFYLREAGLGPRRQKRPSRK